MYQGGNTMTITLEIEQDLCTMTGFMSVYDMDIICMEPTKDNPENIVAKTNKVRVSSGQ